MLMGSTAAAKMPSHLPALSVTSAIVSVSLLVQKIFKLPPLSVELATTFGMNPPSFPFLSSSAHRTAVNTLKG
jgi:hypothetical protein